jgi:two-component system, LytTR family, response regulator
MLKIFIVDDEPAASGILKLLIEKNIGVEKQVETCNEPGQAIELIKQFDPSLVMLDIEMPGINGFDLLNRLGHWDCDIIFTTAYDKYAIKAIRFSALDYLLKPVDIIELQNAINRHIIKKEFPQAGRQQMVGNLMNNLQKKDPLEFKLALSTTEGVFFFKPEDIIRCEGESNYTRFFFPGQKPMLVSRTMKEYEEILGDHHFIRVHKSHLVNKMFVKHVDREGLLWLTDGSSITISRRKKDEVMKELREKNKRP